MGNNSTKYEKNTKTKSQNSNSPDLSVGKQQNKGNTKPNVLNNQAFYPEPGANCIDNETNINLTKFIIELMELNPSDLKPDPDTNEDKSTKELDPFEILKNYIGNETDMNITKWLIDQFMDLNSSDLKPDTDTIEDKSTKDLNNALPDLNNAFIGIYHALTLHKNRYGYNSINSPPHQNVICDACDRSEFVVDRYKCLVCNDYDLCGDCFESRKISLQHVNGHPMVRFSGPNEIFGDKIENENVTLEYFKMKFNDVKHEAKCKGCSSCPISGMRFKCDECNDFDLCYTCFENNLSIDDHKKNHSILMNYSIQNVSASDIDLLDKLGRGSYGTAYKARIISKNKIVVCKVLEWDTHHDICNISTKDLYQSFVREVLAYNEINSNYVIKAYGSCVINNESIQKFYLLTEYMEKDCLTNLLKHEPDLSYRCRVLIACNIASGMRRIHEKGYIHRDIRPDNIFITKNYVAKIGDLGITRLQDKFQNHTAFQLTPYMPDEYRTGKYNNKIDVYTFGLTMYHLITGEMHTFKNNKVELSKEPQIFGKIINKCLENDPSNRPTALALSILLECHNDVLRAFISKCSGFFLEPKSFRTTVYIQLCNIVSDFLKV